MATTWEAWDALRTNNCVAELAGDEQCQELRLAAGLPPLEPISD